MIIDDQPLRDALASAIRDLPIPDVDDANGYVSYTHLRWLRAKILENINSFPIDKLNRWAGFIHGALATRGLFDVEAERSRTRVIYHQAYQEMGLEIPPTIDRTI